MPGIGFVVGKTYAKNGLCWQKVDLFCQSVKMVFSEQKIIFQN